MAPRSKNLVIALVMNIAAMPIVRVFTLYLSTYLKEGQRELVIGDVDSGLGRLSSFFGIRIMR